MSNMTFFTPSLDTTSAIPLYQQLYDAIKNDILKGQISPGTLLPSLRKLSRHLGVSKNTVETAYQQLFAEGFLETRAKAGYFVVHVHAHCSLLPAPDPLPEPTLPLRYPSSDCEYDLSPFQVDPTPFQPTLWKRIINSVIQDEFESLLRFGEPQGELDLRQQITRYLYENRGVICTPDQVVITAGTQYGLGMLCRMLQPQHSKIAVEEPGSQGLRDVLRHNHMTVCPIPIQSDGLNIEKLEASQCSAVLVTPSHQFPKGVILSATNRLRLLAWAQKTGGIILEDDYDSEMRFLGKPIASLKSLDQHDSVVFLGSFSKFFLPSLRISYMVLPKKLLTLYRNHYYRYSQTASTLGQKTLARFIRDGHLQAHIRKVRRLCLQKYRIFLDAIRIHMPEYVTAASGNTGMHMLLELQTTLTEAELVALAEAAGIRVAPLSFYCFDNLANKERSTITMLISYKSIPAEKINDAVQALRRAWFPK